MANPSSFDWINPLATVIAVFLGAYLALLVERHKNAKSIEAGEVAAANIALHTIYNIWSITEHLNRTLLDPVRPSHHLWLDFPLSEARVRGVHKFDLASLAFLMNSSNPMVYLNLTVEEQRFEHLLNLIDRRSDLIRQQVMPVLHRNGKSLFTPSVVTEIETCIGQDLKIQLEALTSSIKEHLEENLSTSRSAHDELRQVMKLRMPRQKFLQGDFTPFADRDA